MRRIEFLANTFAHRAIEEGIGKAGDHLCEITRGEVKSHELMDAVVEYNQWVGLSYQDPLDIEANTVKVFARSDGSFIVVDGIEVDLTAK